MYADFEVYGSSLGLVACAVYGGAPYGAQESKLRRGVDIVIGTPGRVKVITSYFNFSVWLHVTSFLFNGHDC